MKRLFALGLLPLLLVASAFTGQQTRMPLPKTCNLDAYQPWVLYYSDTEPVEAFAPYDPIVLDSDYHPPITPLVDEEKTVMGYVSLGEVGSFRYYFDEVEADGILLAENPNWPGSYFVDVRSPLWKDRLLTEIIPNILDQGFNGLFYDTLDNPLYLEEIDPEGYAGMKAAAIDLVKSIREAFPEVKVMMNRAYDIMQDVGGNIDMELAESLYTDYNFDTEEYEKNPKTLYREQVRKLRKAQRAFPNLEVFSLDYWYPEDTRMLKKIYRKERRKGFRPYVSVIDLDVIVPEPDCQ